MILSACIFGYGPIGKAVVDKFTCLPGYGKDIRIHIVYVKKLKDFPEAQLNNQNFWKINNKYFNNKKLSITIGDDHEWLNSSGYMGHDVIFDCSEKDDDFSQEINDQLNLNNNFVLYKCSSLDSVDEFMEPILDRITKLRKLKFNEKIKEQIDSSVFSEKSNYKLTLNARKTFYSETEYNSKKIIEDDPKRIYENNSNGFRSKKELEKTPLLFAGCSVTYGVGVSIENIWATQVAKLLNLDHTNIGKSGASTGHIVNSIFKYVETYGNPEYLFCLFPDYKRFYVPVDDVFYAEKLNNKNKVPTNIEKESSESNKKFFQTIYLGVEKEKNNKLIKLPYDYKRVFSDDLAIYDAMKSIRYLEQYCRAADIKLFWATWDPVFNGLVIDSQLEPDTRFEKFFNLYDHNFDYSRIKLSENSIKEIFFDNYADFELCLSSHINPGVECTCGTLCHAEIKKEFPDEYFAGTDSALGHPHFGAHWHRHAAESFYNEFTRAKSR